MGQVECCPAIGKHLETHEDQQKMSLCLPNDSIFFFFVVHTIYSIIYIVYYKYSISAEFKIYVVGNEEFMRINSCWIADINSAPVIFSTY